MAKNNIEFLSLFLLHLDCFGFTPKHHQKPTMSSPNSHKHRKALSSPLTFLKRIFSTHSKNSHGNVEEALNEPRVTQVENVSSQLGKACIGNMRKEPKRIHKKRGADRKYRADSKRASTYYRKMQPENERLREVVSGFGRIYQLESMLFDADLILLQHIKSKYDRVHEIESMLDNFKELELNSKRLKLMDSRHGGIEKMKYMLDIFMRMEAESNQLNQIKSMLGIQETESILQKFKEMEDELHSFKFNQIKSSFDVEKMESMASTQQEVPAGISAPAPDVVGNAFVHQYYLILHQSPELLHRFYESSKLGRKNGILSITTTMQAIKEKILALDFGEFPAEITSVDAQDSHNGGVLVLVTGYLTRKDKLKRKFTQTFFLAPQDKGYFVLNDMFRFIDDGKYESGIQDPVNNIETSLAPEQDSSPALENHIEKLEPLPEGANGQVYNPSNSKIEEVPKKSYAPILKVMKENALSIPKQFPLKPSAKSHEQPRPAAPPAAPAIASDPQTTRSNVVENGNNQEMEGALPFLTPAQWKFPLKPSAKSHEQPRPAPEFVGNAFVHQYYDVILHQSPELVHRFYHDSSKLGRPKENGIMTNTTTMQAINEKILALGYGEFTAEITSVDAQDTHNGRVLVLVTGYLTRKDKLKRKFTQTFFLAPQDKGYFVLNDMFRYIDDGKYESGIQDPVNNIETSLAPEQGNWKPLVSSEMQMRQALSSHLVWQGLSSLAMPAF